MRNGFAVFGAFLFAAVFLAFTSYAFAGNCTDSDNGRAYDVRGTTQGIYSDTRWIGTTGAFLNKTDYCYIDSSHPDWATSDGTGQYLAEFYCNDAGFLDAEEVSCPNGCVNGACKSAGSFRNTSDFYWNIDWVDLTPETSAHEESLTVSPNQQVSGKFAYTLWNGHTCRGGCDCIDHFVLGLEGEPKYCLYAGIPWCYPGKSGETSFYFNAPSTPGTYNLYYKMTTTYNCDDAYSVYKISADKKVAGKIIVSQGSSNNCTDSDGGPNIYVKGTASQNGISVTDSCKDGNTLLEGQCLSGGRVTTTIACPTGYSCKEGACVEPCIRAYPDVIIEPASKTVDAGKEGKYQFSITIKNNDNSDCGSSVFYRWGTYNIPSGYVTDDYAGGSLPPIKPGDSFKYNMYVYVHSGTPAGTYYAGAIVENTNAKTYGINNTAAIYVVQGLSQTCTDSDGGNDDKHKGVLTISYNNGKKETTEDWCEGQQKLIEKYCNSDGGYSEAFITCQGGCKDGACIGGTGTEPPEVSPPEHRPVPPNLSDDKQSDCNGCLTDKFCYPIGYRMKGEYCNPAKGFIAQSAANEACENNFECQSNVCASGKCISGDLLQRILGWFKRLLGME